jgi:hypothetical protein
VGFGVAHLERMDVCRDKFQSKSQSGAAAAGKCWAAQYGAGTCWTAQPGASRCCAALHGRCPMLAGWLNRRFIHEDLLPTHHWSPFLRVKMAVTWGGRRPVGSGLIFFHAQKGSQIAEAHMQKWQGDRHIYDSSRLTPPY